MRERVTKRARRLLRAFELTVCFCFTHTHTHIRNKTSTCLYDCVDAEMASDSNMCMRESGVGFGGGLMEGVSGAGEILSQRDLDHIFCTIYFSFD